MNQDSLNTVVSIKKYSAFIFKENVPQYVHSVIMSFLTNSLIWQNSIKRRAVSKRSVLSVGIWKKWMKLHIL